MLGYATLRAAYKISHTFTMSDDYTKINSIKSTQKQMTTAMKININAGKG